MLGAPRRGDYAVCANQRFREKPRLRFREISKSAPRDWDFKAYNSEKNRGKILAFLERSGARMVRIPYRCNRAVIFNSDLFHETDDVRFQDTYLSRRINITLLYGFRAKP